MRREIILKIVKYVAIFGIMGAMIIFSRTINRVPLLADDGTEFARAEVLDVEESSQSSETSETDGTIQKVALLIKSGSYKGEIIEGTSMNGYLYGAYCEKGSKVIVRLSVYDDSVTASVYNYDREIPMAVLLVAFLLLIWLVGGKKGINSIIALAFTIVTVLFLYIPLIYIGMSPFLAAVIAVIVITVVSLFLISGNNKKSFIAIIGTLCGVVFAGLIALVFGKCAHITGYNTTDIETLIYVKQNTKVDVGGILFSGILISSLGAVMDVAMSVASSLNELHEKNRNLGFHDLFKSGMNIGRDMIGTMSNTLILAYVGGSISTVMIVYAYSYEMHQIINMYSIGIEIMRGLSGTMGIILTVPFTSLMASLFFSKDLH